MTPHLCPPSAPPSSKRVMCFTSRTLAAKEGRTHRDRDFLSKGLGKHYRCSDGGRSRAIWGRSPMIKHAIVLLSLAGVAFTYPDPAVAQSPGYAAVAVDGHGLWGASLGLSTPQAAGHDAAMRCGEKCRVVMTGRGRCVAFADSSSGGYWYGHAYGDDAEAVRRIAMLGCSAGAPRGTCRVKHVNCI